MCPVTNIISNLIHQNPLRTAGIQKYAAFVVRIKAVLYSGGTLSATRQKGLQKYIEVVTLPYCEKIVPMYLRYMRWYKLS